MAALRARTLIWPSGDDHFPCLETAPRRLEIEAHARFRATQRRHFHPGLNRRPDAIAIALDELHHIRLARETMGILGRVGEARQLDAPVRKLKAQRVPAFRAPALRNAGTLEHEVLTPVLPQAVTHRQPG